MAYPASPAASPTKPFTIDHMLGPIFVSGGRGLVGFFWRTYLAETGWTSPLPEGGLVEALTLPQTKQSRWHNFMRGLAKQPRRRSPWTSRKAALPQLPARPWLSKEVWLASGWLLAGFLVGHPPAWKNLVLTWRKLAGPPAAWGRDLWRHCPSHKQSKVDGTIPRVGLRSSPGVDRLGVPKKAALP